MAQPFTIEPDPNTLDHPPAFLANGGAVGKLLLSLDAASSPLGPPDAWSASLKTTMATLLPAKAQIVLFWGAEFVALYNDAYAPSIGDKHPRALGRPAIENWRELWDDLEPLLRGVYETGETFAAKDRPFYIERHGRGETVYFDVSYSAVRETDGSVGGVLCIVTETTERVRFERRQAFLLELGQTLPSLADPLEIEATALRRLGEELGASRIFFGEDNGDGMTFQVHRDYLHDGRSAVGRHRYLSFGATLSGELHAGRSVAREDLAGERGMSLDEAASRARLGLGATLHVPVLRHGRLEALLAIHFAHPQALGEDPRRLAEEAAKLAWTSLTHARAELALRTSSAQLAAMFDQASAGIAVCDRSWRFTRVNDRYCEIAGRSRETLLGLRMQDILDPADFALPAAPGGATGAAFEMSGRYVRPDGDTVWVQNQVTPLVDEQHAASGLLCVCMDISARVRAENELRELNESLEERVATMLAQRESALAQLHEARKMEMVGQLTGGIAHDFNNLLTPIMASLELIRAARRRPLHRPHRRRATVRRTGAEPRRSPAHLRPPANPQAAGGGPARAGRRHARPDRALARPDHRGPHRDPGTPACGGCGSAPVRTGHPQPRGERPRRHGRRRPPGNRRADRPGDRRRGGRSRRRPLRVPGSRRQRRRHARRGAGPLHGAVLFHQGRGQGHRPRPVDGPGPGRPVRRRPGHPLGDRQGDPGEHLAADHRGADAIHRRKLPDAPEALRPTHVLLVDDDRMVRYTTALLLGDLGYQVSEAASAEEALGEVERGLAPDLLVTDHLMADKTGVQLAEELRQRFPQLPVLVITGYANLRPEQLNGFEVLTKPFRHNELAERLARLLEASP